MVSNSKKISSFVVFCCICVGVVLLWFFNGFIYPLMVKSVEFRALTGDSFGSVNALFSGLAFAGLIYTIFMQREELALQRAELAMQREQMRETKNEIAKQAVMQEAQVKAMIAQIQVTAFQTEINALQLEINPKEGETKNKAICDIRLRGNDISRQARNLVEEFFPTDNGTLPKERSDKTKAPKSH